MFDHVLYFTFCHIEKMAACAQGKGYGSATIRQEVAAISKLLGHRVALAADIGGNVGNWSAMLRNKNPAAEIHVFEPSKTNVEKLK